MTWYIYQNEDLKREQKIRFPFLRYLTEQHSANDLIFKDELIQSEAIQPPKYPKAGLTKTNCTLTADFSGVDRSQFKQRMSLTGGPFYEIGYDLIVTLQSAMMKFSSEINGKEMGSVEAVYD